jgi:hypothetical protein
MSPVGVLVTQFSRGACEGDHTTQRKTLAHETDMPKYLGDVRYWVNGGKHMLSLSFSGFDPYRTSGLIRF